MKHVKIVTNRHILSGTLMRLIARMATQRARFRYYLVRGLWQLAKEFAAAEVQSIDLSEIAGLEMVSTATIGPSGDRLVLAALSQLVQPREIFEIGTYLGQTTLALARNNPEAHVYTLDLPDAESAQTAELEMTDAYLFQRWDRGSAFRDAPEAVRITTLTGDSATFDFEPYRGKIDLAFIDASHSYSYVKADTEAALRMLSPTGTILWHDYPTYPGVFQWLNELGRTLKSPIFHPLGTGLAFYSRHAALRIDLAPAHPAQSSSAL